MAAGVDVMLNPRSWCWLHIPGAQNRGEFLEQVFNIARDRIWNFLQRGEEGSNRDSFSLRLKLENFTLGFQTTCADMAGGWEEVVSQTEQKSTNP
jgi:hypothetical protein